MTDESFKKVDDKVEKMYGPRKLLLCGFSSDERKSFLSLLRQESFENMPVVIVSNELSDKTLKTILELPENIGAMQASDMEKAVIMSGFMQRELHLLISSYRQSGLPRPLWATLTPVSENWTVSMLLKELAAEREAIQQARKKQNAAQK